MGTSATLFNSAIVQLLSANSSLENALGSLIKDVLGASFETFGDPFKLTGDA